ncbi:MAG: M48 family metallopeptidase [Bacteriovoracaceae bacterium]|nr:M48 family metallopeptidase [Bacteriovoracaceae bacterium]
MRFLNSLIILVLTACASAPLTGRNQLKLVPESQLISSATAEYSNVLKKTKISTNTQQTAMVKRVGERIKNAVEGYLKSQGQSELVKDYHWEFNLLAEPTVNAWAMPGGKVAFYEGIMKICEDETGVAVVMGHEVAHAIAGHGNERVSHGLIQQGIVLGAGALTQKESERVRQMVQMGAIGFTTVAGILPYSRLHESEADEMGLIFMAMAGYDPREAPRFWERMSAQGKSKVPQLLSTHPSDTTRIRKLRAQIPRAMKYLP